MATPVFFQNNSIRDLLTNPIFLSAATSWLLAQVIKAIVACVTTQKRSIKEVLETVVWRTGGMPSSHASVVSSMTTAVAINSGIGSNLFAVCFFLSMVVMRDALGVRRSVGHQAEALNDLGRAASERLNFEFNEVKEIKGHKPLEVIIGGILGICIAVAYAWL